MNPADAPVIILSLTSDTLPTSRIYDIASSVLAQEIAQMDGVGQVNVGGGALPAVRVELNPTVLNKYGISLEEVRSVLTQANANRPEGQFADARTSWEIHSNDQLFKAVDYVPLIVAAHNGAIVRLGDLGDVSDGVQDVRATGLMNGKPAVSLTVMIEPGANVIDTVDGVRAALPRFRALLPAGVDLRAAIDRTTTIRASVHDVERTLVIAIGLVVLVVFAFLRNALGNGRSRASPCRCRSLGTFGAMWFLGYSLDNLSLMALTISTGFVVDDAIVVLENITRHVEEGRTGARGGARGSARDWLHGALDEPVARRRLHPAAVHGRPRRPAVPRIRGHPCRSQWRCRSSISLTTTPMLCARYLQAGRRAVSRARRWNERAFERLRAAYDRTLGRALSHSASRWRCWSSSSG